MDVLLIFNKYRSIAMDNMENRDTNIAVSDIYSTVRYFPPKIIRIAIGPTVHTIKSEKPKFMMR